MDTIPQPSLRNTIIKIILAVVALALLVWAAIYFKLFTISPSETGLSSSEKSKILTNLEKADELTPDLTAEAKKKIISDLDRAAAKAPALTAEQKAQIINNLSK